ncbi:MAG: hypothetical protein P4L91_10450 [Burkholderiaceae bacterium]|nr:hypothetical protein [Burkholderiaceae bacterium]
MILVPQNASQEQVLRIVLEWVEVLAKEDYRAVYSALGYALAFGEPGDECIRAEIKKYRSPEYYPGIVDFRVTDWRTAIGGNPSPKKKVIWYKANSTGLAGAVAFDLPLNGKWSDLTADFVFCEHDDETYVLGLEDIGSMAQRQRESD